MELPIEADDSHVVAATLPTSWMSAPALNHFLRKPNFYCTIRAS